MFRLLRTVTLTIAALALIHTPVPLQAQTYPAKPVTIIVPLAAGTGMDSLVRLYAEPLGVRRWASRWSVENKPGAGLMLGTAAIAAAAPDGHTLGISTATPMAVNPVLYKKINYDPNKDLAPVYLLCEIAVRPGGQSGIADPIGGGAHQIFQGKRKPAELQHAGRRLLAASVHGIQAQRFGLKFTHVPYRSSPQAYRRYCRRSRQCRLRRSGRVASR